jgi:transcriptional regulator with XRE-family HTH domain
LSKRDKAICKRLKQAREVIGLTQLDCARQIGIERTTLNNYESAVTPLKCEVALRFCRQMIVSEEWLALGEHKSFKHLNPTANWKFSKHHFRLCMSLATEPIAQKIRPGSLFSEAYDSLLAPVYSKLAIKYFDEPRITIHPDEQELAHNLLRYFLDQWEAQLGALAFHRFVRSLVKSADEILNTIEEGYVTEWEERLLIDRARESGELTDEVFADPEQLKKFLTPKIKQYLSHFSADT